MASLQVWVTDKGQPGSAETTRYRRLSQERWPVVRSWTGSAEHPRTGVFRHRYTCSPMEGQEWLRAQLTAFTCSSCGRSYVRSRIRVLAQRDDHWFVSLRCVNCGTGALGLVTVRDAEGDPIDGPSFRGEHTPADEARLAGAPPLDADDVIEAHRFLTRFDGDFRRLFGGGEGR